MRALVALAFLVLASCQPDPYGRTAAEIRAERAQCMADGGRFEAAGRIAAPICIIPTPDAGKVCTRSTDCEGLCLATGDDGTGTCSVEVPHFGCLDLLNERGEREIICID